MNAVDATVVEISKKKVLLLVLGACVFVALGVWILSLDGKTIRREQGFYDPIVAHAVGFAAVIFFALCGIVGAKKLFDKRPGLVLNSIGVIDNSSGVAAGMIPWAEVTGVEVFQIQRQKMLIIKVANPQLYIERGNKLKQALNKANYKLCGSPIAISSNALKIDFRELLSLFVRYQTKYGKV